jgi:hypothetical protein
MSPAREARDASGGTRVLRARSSAARNGQDRAGDSSAGAAAGNAPDPGQAVLVTRSKKTIPGRRRRRGMPYAIIALASIGSVVPALASAQDVRPRPDPAEPEPVAAIPPPPHWSPVARRGGQVELLLGATACMPADVGCGLGGGIRSATLPSFGMGLNLGWRINPYFMFGGAYRFGMFHPGSDLDFRFGQQHSIYATVRPIFPVGRVDLGIDLGAGYSRQTFHGGGGDKDLTQGFSFMVGPTIDVFVTDRFFVGAKIDFLLNAHYRVCSTVNGSQTCTAPGAFDIAPVHQVIYGIHLGATFGG